MNTSIYLVKNKKKITKSLITIFVLFQNIPATVTEQILSTIALQIIVAFSKSLNSNNSKNNYPTFHNFILKKKKGTHLQIVFPYSTLVTIAWETFYYCLVVQAGGFCLPKMVGLILTQEEVADPPAPLFTRSMSATTTCWHGTLLLQISFTASFVEEVPLMFLKLTLLILTFEGD